MIDSDQIKPNTNFQHKILIANRGEVACRIIATANSMGIPTVAVFSAADNDARHVSLADEAVYIGPAPSEKSYLVIDNIIQAAQKTGATLIHPGYGFLAENPRFAKRCREAGFIFIGPTAEAIRLMSDKAEAKAHADSLEVPVIPGFYLESIEDPTDSESVAQAVAKGQDPLTLSAHFFKEALQIGAPLMIKAIAGGGGKGMRHISHLTPGDQKKFDELLMAAQREAQSSFSDCRIMLEKYIGEPRHIEVQIIADQYGNTVHLWDRDCSIQRRHQKVVEEAPAIIEPALKQRLYEDAIDLAKSIGYQGAGTVEFLVDLDDRHYFLEMNTRLQVEHCVTEEITGIDIVEWQIRIALGEPLPLDQSNIPCDGHAIEVRLNAERPDQDFLPATGQIKHLNFPETLRIETGIQAGSKVSIHYDPNIAKLVSWGNTREDAIRSLQQGLLHTELSGIETNLYFLQHLTRSKRYIEGGFSTRFLEELEEDSRHQVDSITHTPTPEPYQLLAAVSLYELLTSQAHYQIQQTANKGYTHQQSDPYNPWSMVSGWQLNAPPQQQRQYLYEGEYHSISIREESIGYEIHFNGQQYHFKARVVADKIYLEQHGHQVVWVILNDQEGYTILTGNAEFRVDNILYEQQDSQDGNDAQHIATMPGAITKIHIAEKVPVEAGAPIMVLEAMKMEHTLAAPSAGHVTEFFFSEGDSVNEGDILYQFETSETVNE